MSPQAVHFSSSQRPLEARASSARVLIAGLLVLALYSVPLFSTMVPPLFDYPNHLARFAILATGGNEFYDVRWAPNGEVGLVDFEASPADLILLDMRMPVMDGWEFGYEFRRRYNHTTPIVVLTAAESAARRAREALADCFLGKPFDLRDLRRIAQRFAPVAA